MVEAAWVVEGCWVVVEVAAVVDVCELCVDVCAAVVVAGELAVEAGINWRK